MDMVTLISWVGFIAGLLIGIPQIIKTMQMKRAEDVSALTFVLIEVTMICFLIRSVAINDVLFAAYYFLAAFINAYQLVLIARYRSQGNSRDDK